MIWKFNWYGQVEKWNFKRYGWTKQRKIMSLQSTNINTSYLSIILNDNIKKMPKNLCKYCPVAKQNFRNHYVCHKSHPSIQKYRSFKNYTNWVRKKFLKKYLQKGLLYQLFQLPEVKDLSKETRDLWKNAKRMHKRRI